MFRQKNDNKKQLGKGVTKMKNILICMIALVIVAFCATGAWAAGSQTVTVNAVVPTVSGGLTLSISKINATSGVWTKNQTSINFGTLTWNTTYSIFTASSYYAVDVGVADNSGTVWTLTHTRASLKKDATNNLDNNVNVAFAKETLNSSGATVETALAKYSFNNSQNVHYTKTQIGSGYWLRMYYGIGTGDPAKPDASGVTPIGLDKPAGTYAGSITITLTP